MSNLKLIVINASKSKSDELSVPVSTTTTIQTLKKILSPLVKIPHYQIGIFLEETVQDKDGKPKQNKKYITNIHKTVESLGWKDGEVIYVKNQGLQMFRRFIYVVEYLGPLLIVMYFYLFKLTPSRANFTQNMAFLMSVFHYLKRTLESLFVHEFSFDYLPLMNLFVNCTYYWGLFGLSVGHYIFNTNYVEPSSNFKWAFVLFFFSAEFQNLQCHLHLRDIKIRNRGERAIPFKNGYELVSMANYFWEFLSWLFFSLYVNHASAYIFCFAGLAIMSNWALKRHAEYKKTFGDKYPKGRKAIIPFIL